MIHRTKLMHDIQANLTTSLPTTAEQLDNCLRSLLDKHAPATKCRVAIQKCSPWYNSVRDQLRTAKKDRRKAERLWLSTRLTIHKQIYDAAKKNVTNIVHAAKSAHYSTKIMESSSCKELFEITNKLMSRNKCTPLPATVSLVDLPDLFANFFRDKVQTIRDKLDNTISADSSSPYSCDTEFQRQPLAAFEPVSMDLVRTIVMKSAPKSCELDPIPTSLLLECLDPILPSLTDVINTSLSSGEFPSFYKTAIVKPLLKKPTLDHNDLKNYRPVSNLPFMSKILEKVVLSQLVSHLNSNSLFSNVQSAYRPRHSTETTLLKVVNDLLSALDGGKITVLTLLDLSAAFDTIDHDILLPRLQHVFGIHDTALLWFKSYLVNRTQIVSANGKHSSPVDLCCGVPQGSVLGPVLFILYTQPLSSVIDHHPVSHQLYADDTQIYKSSHPAEVEATIQGVERCISDVKSWMTCNKLQMNDDKTEAILITKQRLSHSHPLPQTINISNTNIKFTQSVRNLGVTLDSTLSLHQHVMNICKAAYLELRRISSIRKYLSVDATKTLVCSLVLSRLDYCNSILSGSSQYLLQKLQKVQNTAARIILRVPRSEHASPLLCTLHWLCIRSRIKHKICSLCYISLTGSSPTYLSDLTHVYTPARYLRSSSDTRILIIPTMKMKSYGQRSFAYQGPVTWNELPAVLRHKDTVISFKRALKTHLFQLQQEQT